LKLGIQLPEVERVVRWPEYVAMARAAEAAGYDSIWLGDHLLYDDPPRGPWEVWTLLSAIAAVTERATIGPLVACTAFHPPAVLAKMASTVDEISGGRFVLGLGAGWNKREFDAFGIPYDRRVSRFEEAFTIIRGLLAGERVTFHGRYADVEDAVLLPAPARPLPLMIGSNGPRMLSIALPHVDAWNTWYDGYGNSAEGFARLNATVSDAARRAGRDPAAIRRSACVLVVPGERGGERPETADAPAICGGDAIEQHLRALARAGADEAILVADPITEASVRELGRVLTRLGR
jgi:probable F420-dependent oxidoreductase